MNNQKTQLKPGLYIIATPIGNREDISLRALRILKDVDIIACEDTRVSQKLLKFYNISTKTIHYNDHSKEHHRRAIIDDLHNGKSVALTSDAGTPLISDPGFKLVSEVQEAGIYVTTIPGPSALIAALTLSGLPSDRFFFEGFLPAKSKQRQERLLELKNSTYTVIFYEAPRRLCEVLGEVHEIFGENRGVVVVRELTKMHEEVKKGSAISLQEYYQQQAVKGEIVLLISPMVNNLEYDIAGATTLLKDLIKHMSLKDAVKEASDITKLPKNKLYQVALKIVK